MKITCETKIKTRIVSPSGKIISERPWEKNLILNAGLDGLALKAGLSGSPANCNRFCSVGSGTNPNSIASGAITFTQVTTTITASGGFFTSNMVGGIFKYGTGSGGAEYYITAFTDSMNVTVDTSATVAVPSVATVWQVQQTALQTKLYETSTYQTNSGDCGSTFTATTVTHQRTFVFPAQASPYTVNEIGYSSVTGVNMIGRVVLSSSDVVGTTNIYIVVVAITLTYSPSVPTAVIDVGTGIVTAGNAMIEWWSVSKVNSDGTTDTTNTDLDVGNTFLQFPLATYTQAATIGTSPGPTFTTPLTPASANWTYATILGTMKLTLAGSISTTGQTIYGLGIRRSGGGFTPAFDIKFTTPVVLPTGTFAPTAIIQMVYGRTLTN